MFAVGLRFFVWNSARHRRWSMAVLRRMCRILLKLLDIHVVVDGNSEVSYRGREGLLLIPNHLSYLDVIVIQAVIPTVFVTSREIQETPVLGQITTAAGCLYTERRHKGAVLRDINEMAGFLDQGFNVTVFPEGTTTDGRALLPFKSTLVESALRSRARVLPICIRYEGSDGTRLDPDLCDYVAWYGDQKFFPHLKRLMRLKSIHVRLSLLGPIPIRSKPCRKHITAQARQLITSRYHAPE
jgi:1-acyl-sn-glycerol-3-phosphate acyltransferase